MKSGNPTLQSKHFEFGSLAGQEAMTKDGAYMKTVLLLVLCATTASFTWGAHGMAYVIPGVIGGLVFALITMFKKEWAGITAPLYAICEGVALGAISYMYEAQYSGMVFNAIISTFAVMAIMLFIFKTGVIKVTDKLRVGIAAATGAIFLVYMIGFVMSFFGASIPMIHESGPIGIGFSVVVIGIAAFNLLLDFDFIEKASDRGNTPKYMEWYAAFGLVVTLIWLYLEILRLLSKINRK